MNKENRLIESFTTVGGVLLLFGAAVMITGWEYAPYLYLAGSFLFAVGQFADRYDGTDRIIRRLRAQQVTGACFLLITVALMFADGLQRNLFRPTLESITVETEAECACQSDERRPLPIAPESLHPPEHSFAALHQSLHQQGIHPGMHLHRLDAIQRKTAAGHRSHRSIRKAYSPRTSRVRP